MNKHYDTISVVVPCFNSGATIENTILSIKNQTWPNVEIIVVDDGSNDEYTLNVLANLKDVTLLRKVNGGLSSARNLGFSNSTGKFFLPLDADDRLDPQALEIMHNTLNEFADCSFVYSDVNLEGKRKGKLVSSFNLFEQLFSNKLPYCIFMKRELFSMVGGYDETMIDGYEDWEFNIRIGAYGFKGAHCAQPLFFYMVSESGMLISKSNRLHGYLWRKIQNKNKKIYNLKAMFKAYLNSRKQNENFISLIYFLTFIIHKILPIKIFNLIFLVYRKIR